MLILTMLFWLLIISLLFPRQIQAQNDFTINENIEYTLNLEGEATVTHQVDITNNFSQIYPKEYQIQIQGLPITNLRATDGQGSILQSFTSQGDSSLISLKFNQSQLGKGKTTSFTLNYKIPELAKHKGKTWDLSLPQSTDTSISQSQITLKTPPEYGNLSFSSIKTSFSSTPTENIIKFQNNNHSKILITFGNYQLFNFQISYFLKNPSDNTVLIPIAIVPDTRSQSVYYQSIVPQPESIKADADGNWLAQYRLSPHEELSILTEGQVKTVVKPSAKTTLDFTPYLQEQKFWPVSDPQISSLASTLGTPKSIYDYVVSTLDYNYNRLNAASRKGALAALQNPSDSLCTEFTDLFITLARNRGIPAREIEGYAYSTNSKIKPINTESDILHAWPEYFDTTASAWRAVDPTWGKTTNGIDYFTDLDLNHITFVTHGLNSQQPLPPGSYPSPQNPKSINISFATEEMTPSDSLPTLTLQNHQLLISNPFPNSQNNLHLSSSQLNFEQDIGKILPYSSETLTIPAPSFFRSLLPQYQQINFSLTDSNGQNSTLNLKYTPHFINLGICLISAIVILSLSGIIITSTNHEKTT